MVCVANDGHRQTIRRVGCKADVEVFFVDQRVAVKRCIEVRKLLKCCNACLDDKRQHGDLDAGLFILFVERDTEGFKIGDVGIVVIGDMRDHHPVAVQVCTANFLDARQRLDLNRTKLGEVHFGPWQQAQACAITAARCFRRGRSTSLRLHRTGHDGFGERLYVIHRDTAFGACTFDLSQRHAKLARKLAHRG